MACCGQQRRGLSLANGTLAAPPKRQLFSRVALYEYTGAAGMTVTGRMSGAHYRFATPGSRVQVDLRDVASMAGLPNLRRLE